MKKRKNKNIFIKIIKYLAIIVFLFIGIKCLSFSYSSYQKSIWKNNENLRIVVLGKEYVAIFISSLTRKIYVVKIPKNTAMKQGPFSGNYDLQSIKKLDNIENKKNEYVKTAVSYFFGINFENQIENKDLDFEGFDFKLRDVLAGKTNLSIFDYLKIKNSSYKIEKIDLSRVLNSTREQINNQQYVVFDPIEIDSYFRTIIKDRSLSLHKLVFQFKYFQTDDYQKKYFERMVSNIGWKLADIETSVKKEEGQIQNICLVKESNDTIKTLEKLFQCKIKRSSSINYDVVVYFYQ